MLFRREKYLQRLRPFYHSEELIKVITGVRGCGKTCLMHTVAAELTERGVADDSIIFIDLEATENRKVRTGDDLEQLILSRIKKPSAFNYLFIDELWHVKGFEEVINGFRTEGGMSIFVTSSVASLMDGEMATKLTGRYLEFELYTLTFDEYLHMKEFCGKATDPNLSAEFESFVLSGGFPRAVFIDDAEEKRSYVAGIIAALFGRVIKKQLKIRDTSQFFAVRSFIFNNFATAFSAQSLTGTLVKNGFIITRATTARYLEALLDAKVIYECRNFDLKLRRELAGERKFYPSSPGYYFAQNPDAKTISGPVLENIVFLYARSLGFSVYGGRRVSLEWDFTLRRRGIEWYYLQVAPSLGDEETADRVYPPLEKIRDNYPKFVLSLDPLLQKRGGILHANLIKHLSQGKDFY